MSISLRDTNSESLVARPRGLLAGSFPEVPEISGAYYRLNVREIARTEKLARKRIAAATTIEGPDGVSSQTEPKRPVTPETMPIIGAKTAICSGVRAITRAVAARFRAPRWYPESLGSSCRPSAARGKVPMPRSLHLKSLKLRNFKGIAELDLTFDESLTLLAGVNGSARPP